jgi:hypothetical protein
MMASSAASLLKPLFDYFVGKEEGCGGHPQPHGFRGSQVDDQLEFVRLLNRDVRWLGSAKYFDELPAGLPGHLDKPWGSCARPVETPKSAVAPSRVVRLRRLTRPPPSRPSHLRRRLSPREISSS